MKPKMVVLAGAITLIAVLATPVRPAAQESQGAEAVSSVGTTIAPNRVPLINQPLVPDAAKPGGTAFVLTVNGTGFVSGSVVKWNGSPRATTLVSRSQLKATILSSDIVKPGTASVTVRLAYLFVFRNQRLEAFGPHADEHLAAVLRVAHALDQPALLEPVENVRRRISGKACPLEEPARSDGAARSTEDEVETLVSVALH
jgi:hypothetical protein